MKFSTPRTTGLTSSAAYRANGKKPLFDAATCARIRRRRDESQRYRSRSAIVSWLVGACLVGLGIVLAAIVWAS